MKTIQLWHATINYCTVVIHRKLIYNSKTSTKNPLIVAKYSGTLPQQHCDQSVLYCCLSSKLTLYRNQSVSWFSPATILANNTATTSVWSGSLSYTSSSELILVLAWLVKLPQQNCNQSISRSGSKNSRNSTINQCCGLTNSTRNSTAINQHSLAL
jgi:hypothetical protein